MSILDQTRSAPFEIPHSVLLHTLVNMVDRSDNNVILLLRRYLPEPELYNCR